MVTQQDLLDQLGLPAPSSGAYADHVLFKIATQLEEIKLALARGVNPLEDLVMGTADTPTINITNTSNQIPIQIHDVWRRPRFFSHLSITQVEISSPSLAVADSITVRLYRAGNPTLPQDLVADFTGASQLSDNWIATFSNRRIEFTPKDQDKGGIIWISVTNNGSVNSIFRVSVWGRAFPVTPSQIPGF